jgi:hypothetical protein
VDHFRFAKMTPKGGSIVRLFLRLNLQAESDLNWIEKLYRDQTPKAESGSL